MTVLSIPQAATAARAAGFSGEPLVTVLAIALAESGLNPAAVHTNSDATRSVDRGLLQINSLWHAEVTDAQAFDPAAAFRAGWTISAKGTNFTPWSTFTAGAYLAHVAAVRAALGQPAPTTVTKPAWTFVGTGGHNIFVGVGRPKLAIVAHIMEGTLAGCDSWFANPAAQASANFGVGKDGAIHCYVDPEGADAPWANGLVQQPDATVQALLASQRGINPNLYTVSIEHEGNSGDTLSEAQRDASAHLAAWLCQRFGIPADEDHLLGHYEIDSVTRAQCPGWNRAQWLAWEAAIGRELGAQPQPLPTPVPTPTPKPLPPPAPSDADRYANITNLLYAAQWLSQPGVDWRAALTQVHDRAAGVAAWAEGILTPTPPSTVPPADANEKGPE